MPKPALRSRSLRRRRIRTPGGIQVTRYERRKPSHASCSSCGTKLVGVPRKRPSKVSKIPKTKKRPERPFGGNMCSPCTRQEVKARVFRRVYA